MISHKHAGLTFRGRVLLVQRVLQEHWTVALAAEAAGVSRRTPSHAVHVVGAVQGRAPDGASRSKLVTALQPGCMLTRAGGQFDQLRRQCQPLWRIAPDCGGSLATISRHMARAGLSRLAALQPPEPIRRYERASPGELLLHIDTKRLGGNRAWAIASQATGPLASGGSAGRPCTWTSTITRACPSPRLSPTRRPSAACSS
jgi:hypothetical protein